MHGPGCWQVSNDTDRVVEYQLIRPAGTVLIGITIPPGGMWQECPAPGFEISGPCIERFRAVGTSAWISTRWYPDGLAGWPQPWYGYDGTYFRVKRFTRSL